MKLRTLLPGIALLVGASMLSACESRYEAEADLPEMMLYMQRYFEKLHLAGSAGHWELAAFYAHELEDVAEVLRDAGIEKRGVDLGDYTEQQFLPAVRAVDEAIDIGREAFGARMAELATACNACHAATGYQFVRIIVPETERPYPSQAFTR